MNEAVEGHAPVGQRAARPGEAPEGTVFMSRTKSFTRRTRELPANLARTWEAHASRYVVEPRRGVGYTTVAQDFTLDLAELFGRRAPVTLEIGSGTGEQIVAAASAHPERDFLALEVWVPGIAKLISKAVEAGVDNIRVIEADAAQALPIMLGEACLDEVWTFFPDPWRKARHRKRRLVSDAFALEVARLLRDGGVWRRTGMTTPGRCATSWRRVSFSRTRTRGSARIRRIPSPRVAVSRRATTDASSPTSRRAVSTRGVMPMTSSAYAVRAADGHA